MNKDILIVGAGISGLSAGCYARMNGYNTNIFEMHDIPGGLCTAWERKGYKFDISMHMLTGSVSGPFHRMWEELGVIRNFRFHFHDHISLVEGMGRKLNFYTDRDRLEKDMLAISPADREVIGQFTRLIFGPDMMNAASLKPRKLNNMMDRVRMFFAILPLIRVFTRYKNETIQQFASRFRDPFLQQAVRFFIDAPGWPMIGFPMVALAGFVKNGVTEAGAPLGGSQQVINHLAGTFTKMGGEIFYGKRVKDLIVEQDRVSGIILENGEEHRAGQVIWAGDGHTLVFDILGGRYMDERIRNMYDTWIPVKPIVHVMIGVDMDLSKEPHRMVLEADEPVTVGGKEHRWLSVLHHCFDRSMAPEGKSAVEVWYDTEFDFWPDLRKNIKAYKAEKKRIADYTIAQLEKRWPGFASRVEVVDIPTPATYHRYTGNWKGSPDGWYVTTENMRAQEPVRTLPGLSGMQMVGQWTAPFTGTVIASLTGRQAVQLLCKQDGKTFRTNFIS
ncbi:MAG: NAD(P)/FAD-dependent oxidoreductase [Bacteroidetes bacterium]|nr:MAG: NAD(P)/FAD-dependent oxidoreductase [Bacteroidota bacterium]